MRSWQSCDTDDGAMADFDAFDDSVAAWAHTLDIDPVCSTSDWALPNAAAFAPGGQPHLLRHDAGMVALLEHHNPRGPVLTGFDSIWGFSSPLVGPDPETLVAALFDDLVPHLDHYALSLCGIAPGSELHGQLTEREPVLVNETTRRCVADLSDGFERWLARRSSRFRRSLRAAVNRAPAAGVEVEWHQVASPAEVEPLLARVLAVEATSWKFDAESGLIGTPLGQFTAAMSRRFARRGALRVLFARLGDRDIGYVIGGLFGDRYRGFQHSFDQAHADLAIGKLLQFHNIERLCAEGTATYDMGMHMDYKISYTDRIEPGHTLIFAGGSAVDR